MNADLEAPCMVVPFDNEVEPTPPLGIEPLLNQDTRNVLNDRREVTKNLRATLIQNAIYNATFG
jgi:hypothetical protein